MIRPSVGLPDAVLSELADLERRVVVADGGRLKLEWNALRTRSTDTAHDVLVRDSGGRLVGFVGVYRHGGEPEIAGMVDPAHRRQGFGTAALREALRLIGDAGPALLVVPRASVGGHRLADRMGGTFDHAEHALVLPSEPPAPSGPEGLSVRPATEADRAASDRIVREGFGFSGGSGDRLDHTVVGELDGRVVASLVADRGRDSAGAGGFVVSADVYGFAVETSVRGRGIGRAVLTTVCRDLLTQGVSRVRLEVAVDNEHALSLYTSLGFEPVTTEDYYRLATF